MPIGGSTKSYSLNISKYFFVYLYPVLYLYFKERESDRRRRDKMLRDRDQNQMGGDIGMPMGGGGGVMGLMPMTGLGGPSHHMGAAPGAPMGGGGGRGMMDLPNTSGVPTTLLQQLGIDGPVTNQLFVANVSAVI